MSKYHVGDTFKIQIAEIFKGAESKNDKYRIKGFDNLVFDDNGLGKLESLHAGDDEDRIFSFGDIVKCGDSFYVVVAIRSDELICLFGYSRLPVHLNPEETTIISHANEDDVVRYINRYENWECIKKYAEVKNG